jgi:copper transport protein
MRLLPRLLATLGLARLRPLGETLDKEVPRQRPRQRSGAIFVLLTLAAGLVFLSATAGATVALLLLDRPPAEDSAEARFARDMIIHHSQAVEMAEMVRERTESEEIRTLAADIALTQQGQIGQMQGWLAVWDVPATGSEPPMSWMGHPTEGRMPGMASPEEIEELSQSSAEEADALFLQLMILHHEAALPMTEAILERTDRPEIRQLAEAMYSPQQNEIKVMQDLLLSMGSSPVETEPAHEEDHGASSSEHAPVDPQETAASSAHGATLGAVVFLVGLVAFVALVWLPTSRAVGAGQNSVGLFVRWIWALFALLVVAGAVELSLYAIRASGEPFSLGLLEQALFGTRVGYVWSIRLGLGLLTAIAATWAARQRRPTYYWWVAAGVGGALLATLTQLSHAAAEEGFLPFLADWLHLIAASLWMGGLLGFPLVLWGPLRAMTAKQRARLRGRAVRRFSKVATLAVMTLIVTGVYAILLHVPSVEGLLTTPYGRALMVKLGLAVLLLVAGSVNLVLEGRGPFGRIVGGELILAILIFVATGFLTTLPPASVASP